LDWHSFFTDCDDVCKFSIPFHLYSQQLQQKHELINGEIERDVVSQESILSSFPELYWEIWRFSKIELHLWSHPTHQIRFLDWIEKDWGGDIEK